MLKNILKFNFVLLFFLLFTQSVQAANLYLDSNSKNLYTDRKVEIDLYVDTENQKLNAFEGQISFPVGLLDFYEIRDNDSIITFWIEKPEATKQGIIKFSGIIPGGFDGKGKLFRMFFYPKAKGEGNININSVKSLLNDGQGTEVYSSTKSFTFVISDQAPQDEVVVIDISDLDPPEPFSPIITKITEIGGDDYLLIFDTKDKGSGIDYYQVKEGLRPFVKATSPYVLKNQKLNKEIIIKAVDKSGNERKITIDPIYPLAWYEKTSFFAILIIAILISFFMGGRNAKKQKRKNKNK